MYKSQVYTNMNFHYSLWPLPYFERHVKSLTLTLSGREDFKVLTLSEQRLFCTKLYSGLRIRILVFMNTLKKSVSNSVGTLLKKNNCS